ncbi:DUF2975 domain-containing protein [Arthrobacter crusticola]|uniref:DUF2975 domain-containing protein n=1 Tax=Arthrobacter crusticola TaxID=2547960 RepID=A0A4R5U2S7_9MICC|nr:DUF2975 domain-containing protein [Arthrobacter crusticola]TDK27981.1 DUF2975 domain-containing protein [Arthrobacter crusticola]
MTTQEALPLRFFLGVLVLAAVLVQLVAIPGAGASYARAYPKVAQLAPPYVTALVAAFIALELALLAAWKLVSAVVAGRAMISRSTRWAGIMAASLMVTALIGAGVSVHAGSVARVGGPAMLFGLLFSLALVPAAFALRRWVMGWLQNDAPARVPQ